MIGPERERALVPRRARSTARSEQPRVRVGQIGVGYWGPNLLRAFDAQPRCELVGVADAAASRRAFVAEAHPGLAVHDDAEALLCAPDVDAVVIATPVDTHFALAMRALGSGKHVLVEKPMATTVAEVEAIGRLAESSGLVAMSGHTFLFDDAIRALKRLLDDGALGDLRYIYTQRLDLGRIGSDVSALWRFGPHEVSVIQYLLDGASPLSVSVRGMDYVQDGIEDVVFVHLEYPGKVMAHIHLSWLDPKHVCRTVVVGSERMAVYEGNAEHKIAVYDKGTDPIAELGRRMDLDGPGPAPFACRSEEVVFPALDCGDPLQNEVAHFLDCILDGIPCETGSGPTADVVRILAMAETSA
jgi:predicted dehydrogenase